MMVTCVKENELFQDTIFECVASFCKLMNIPVII
jgi:hypothetical protein